MCTNVAEQEQLQTLHAPSSLGTWGGPDPSILTQRGLLCRSAVWLGTTREGFWLLEIAGRPLYGELPLKERQV